ncbi:glycoside hydrolase family 3 N-terminal domain-containing protein [Flammeovirga sp. EKP202]|uniref:glycoside hydrolase family 3 N-terminal domain-containing protein n=1 Tax=Flammeovirga sp. EKP202 TaxID=2770592 RepID=UPI00165F3391|nr:glycoside hydrolase family 3 N-terminal domain-containing protein [Flammeovirga sp. EKP202]MBD0403751.1 glycoside hydrolase family 3 C-terminal domain-containing protein [Flammeovirga sp. EKP202]
MKLYYYSLLLATLFFGCTTNQQLDPVEQKVEDLLSKMTIDEKIGQTSLRGTSSRVKGDLPESLKEAVRKGEIGAFLNIMNTDYVDELQRIAVEESPNNIPLIFGRDVIHGFKTMFPIPLAVAATWDPQQAEITARVSAFEGTSSGVNWTFAPMLDIARDSRWGRIAESPGEDPLLGSLMGAAYVKGFQGDDLTSKTSMVACAKHFLGYGAAIGGRDYNTAIIHDPLLYNVYIPPFKAAIAENVQTFMSSFNELNGVPASGDKKIMMDLLRGKMNFDGFVVSDWNSVTEMIPHGYAKDEKHAAELGTNAGVDMEMTSQSYEKHIKELLEEGKLSMDQLDFLVKNILRVKIRMGLFETPYRDKHHNGQLYAKDHLEKAKVAAAKSIVLLKNENQVLPLTANKKVALIGPLADAPLDQMGTWSFDGEKEHSHTPLMALKDHVIGFEKTLDFSRDKSKKSFHKAIALAKKADVILFVGGEEAILSGEAHSRAEIDLPGAQEELILELAKLGKPIVLTIMAGRPITIGKIKDKLDGIVMAWHGGTMAGPALKEVLYAERQPEGRLPVTWPKTSGQLPYYYNHKNTGRPAMEEKYVAMYDIPVGAWQSSLGNESHYLDAGYLPEYPFGYGLNYSNIAYSATTISSNQLKKGGELTVEVTITNNGDYDAIETVQLYVQDVVGSITRPVRELKDYQKVHLKKGEKKKVSFQLHTDQLKFYNRDLKYVLEKGDFKVWIAPNALASEAVSFELI